VPVISGTLLRQWREHAGLDVPELALRIFRAAKEQGISVAKVQSLERQIYRWEDPGSSRDGPIGQRYPLLYVKVLGLRSLTDLAAGPHPAATAPAVTCAEPASVPAPSAVREEGSSAAIRVEGGRRRFGGDFVGEIAHESQVFGDWVAMSDVADETIGQYQAQVRRLACGFEYANPLPLLLDTRRLRDLVAERLRGHVRPGQARDLYLLGAEVCGLLAWMTGDLGDYRAADKHVWAAWACAEQAGHDGARAWVRATQAKLAYWDGRYAESASLAASGLDYAAGDSARVFAALFQARALARSGQHAEARQALADAGTARGQVTLPDHLGGVWGLTAGRFHGLAASTWLLLGEPGRVLADAAQAITLSQTAPPAERHLYSEVLAHTDSACAHLQRHDIDGAAAALRPVLDLPAQSRIDPVRQQVTRFRLRLVPHEADAGSAAAGLRDEIETWDRTAIPRQITPS
jgi:hypothetical protein